MESKTILLFFMTFKLVKFKKIKLFFYTIFVIHHRAHAIHIQPDGFLLNNTKKHN